MSKYKPIRSAIEKADQRRRHTRRFNDLIATFISDVERLSGRAVSEAERQLISDAALCAVVLEQMAADAARGDMPDMIELNRLTNTKTRALRRLGLLGDLPRPTVPRRSQSAKLFDDVMAERDDPQPDAMANYVAERQERIARIAARVGADPSLFDESKGGRLDPDECRALYKEGKTKELRKMIAEAKTAQREALAAQRDDDDDMPAPPPKKRVTSGIRRVTA